MFRTPSLVANLTALCNQKLKSRSVGVSKITMHRRTDACSITSALSSAAKSWSSLAFVKNDSCAAERLAKPQADRRIAGAWTLAVAERPWSKNNEQ